MFIIKQPSTLIQTVFNGFKLTLTMMKKNLLIQHFYILITCDFVYSLAMKISNNNNSEILHRISIADIESEDS